MQVVDANKMFSQAKCFHQGNEHAPQDFEKAGQMYNAILTHNNNNPIVLYTLASLEMEKGNIGMSIALMERVLTDHPDFGECWNNLGIAYRASRQTQVADDCFAHAVTSLRDHKDEDIYADALCNRAAMNCNRGTPEKSLEFCDQALSYRPDHKKAKWHKALALLELQRWDEAWKWHEARLEAGAADHNCVERNYAEEGTTPWWDGESPGLIAIHGEQGLGDEIMFSSCIPDMAGEGRRFVFEPSPRMHNLFQRSFDNIEVHGSHATDGRDWIEDLGRPDFKIALGSLPRFCRKTEEDFPGTSYLIPSPMQSLGYGKRLAKLGPRPKVGIAWQGGRPNYRSPSEKPVPQGTESNIGTECRFHLASVHAGC